MLNKLVSVAAGFLLLVASVGAEAVSVDLVNVGNPGNAGELSGLYSDHYRICGAVDYRYQIGKFEVTAGQYKDFLNAVARTDTYGLWNPYMSYDFRGCQITRTGSPGNHVYSVASQHADKPVNYISWGDAVRFVNWLSNGQPSGPQNLSTTEDGSYYLNGATTEAELWAVTRKPDATFVIPTEDEWYKAAYHKNNGPTADYWDYPTSSDVAPGTLLPDTGNNANTAHFQSNLTPVGSYVNSPSPYGTFDQGGNVFEWVEGGIYDDDKPGSIRGGSFNYDASMTHALSRRATTGDFEGFAIGFRVAYLPEPGSALLAMLGLGMVGRRRDYGVGTGD